MTTRDWKVGDRVVDCLGAVSGIHVIEYIYKQKAMAREEGTENIREWHVSNFKEAPPESELDAIERDMTELFARMRAAIERLK